MALRKTPREKALGVVEAFDAQGAKWAAEREAALSNLSNLEATLGEAALADAALAAQLPKQMQELRDRALVAGQALAAAEATALAARRSAVRAEAEEMAPALAVAREALQSHDSRSETLLRALEAHTG